LNAKTGPAFQSRASEASTLPATESNVLLSFDVEEHDLIDQASGLVIDPTLKTLYSERLEPSTHWLLEALSRNGQKATFFIVGRIAQTHPELVRSIHQEGHEVASHGWEHRRVHTFTREEFREDTRRSKEALEQVTGEAIRGYRAPTFSIVKETAWALDVLAELDFLYDSSIFPVYHDRYGVPDAPRGPFLTGGGEHEILEFPPATLRLGGVNVPVGGGGYFRLFPLALLLHGLRQLGRECSPAVGMLYFHPWEFDPEQPRLPLRPAGRFRTYVGIGRSRGRLEALLARYRSIRTVDVASQLAETRWKLPRHAWSNETIRTGKRKVTAK